MKKSRFNFKYNHETLSFEPVKRSFSAMFKRAMRFLFSTTFVVIIVVFLMFKYIKSPKEVMLEREVENMEFNYQVLSNRLVDLEKVLQDLQVRDDNIYRVILEAEPVPSTVREGSYGGADKYAKLDNYKSSQIVINTTKRLDKLASQIYIQSKSFDEVYELAKQKDEMLVSIPAILPIYCNNDAKQRFVSSFGMRPHPIYKVIRMHAGVDFSSPIGAAVFTTGNGVVSEVKYHSGYGNTIIIDHGFNYRTLYAHLSASNVRVGQKVTRGELIGKTGNTGTSVGPHLHYEVHYKGTPIDPVNYFTFDLTPEEYQEMMQISATATQTFD